MSGWRCGVLAGVVGLAVILATGAAAGSVAEPLHPCHGGEGLRDRQVEGGVDGQAQHPA